jgi:peroxiredoxin
VLCSGTPAAFSGTCSEQHLPGFFSKLSDLRDKGIKEVFVISANDPFVMNAWKTSLRADAPVFLPVDIENSLAER